MGGIGKTALSVKLAQQLLQSDTSFEFIIWRTLRNAPPLELLLTDLIQILSCQRESLPALPISSLLNRLIHYLRQHRCLLILDNGETILQGGQFTGLYRPDYEAYGELLRQVGEIAHQSCVVLTSREKPETIANLEGDNLPVRSFALAGLPEDDSDRLFDAIGLLPSPIGRRKLIEVYSGNPLALKIVATSIRELFDGNVDAFVSEETTIFNGIRRLLDRQFNRLMPLERQVMNWLSIEREWVTIAKLQTDIVPSVPKQRLMETLESLSRRSLIEQKNGRFTQQPVVMEYTTERLIDRICEEIQTVDPDLLTFNSYALIQATARDYVRESQVRTILQPIADRVWQQFRSAAIFDRHMRQILTTIKNSEIASVSYGAGNLINLMHQLQLDLTGYDFTELAIRQACLQTVPLHRVNLSGAQIIDCQFAETIGPTYSLAINTDIDRLAIGGEDGTIHIWQASTGQPLLTIEAHTTFIFALTFSQDGRTLVSGGIDSLLRFWDVTTGTCLETRKLDGSMWGLALSPDGKLLAGSTSSEHRALYVWDGSSGECLNTLTGHDAQSREMKFIPSPLAETGWLLVSGSHDCTLKSWDLERGDCLRTLTGHTSIVFTIGVRPQADLIASGSFDSTIKLWNWQTGECVRTLVGHTAEVTSISFSPDRQLLASGSNDLTIRIWEVETGECLQVLQGHQDQIWKIAFTIAPQQDGSKQLILISIGFDRTMRFWHICTLAATPPLPLDCV
ncbi:NB-ARC domain-containing protein [Chamaesiphon polymorphus]|uniref:WD40 domain-containing protein n=1 Tax=Chamaesiphon polymorphus TaxID=2107691 RepID=UPI001FE83FE0|nr:NB-ARC domain-containing protein [Chamaesiphon polymorphus]